MPAGKPICGDRSPRTPFLDRHTAHAACTIGRRGSSMPDVGVNDRRGVLFDMDGVLVSTEPLKGAAHSATVKVFGADVPVSLYMTVMGRSHSEVRDAFLKAAKLDIDAEIYSGEFRRVYADLLRSGVKLAPGARELVDELATEGFAMAVVSSSQRWMMQRILNATGLAPLFRAVVSANDIENEKPAPDAYQLALEELGLHPGAAVAIEDSEAGIQAAKRAGVRVIGIRHELNKLHDFRGADAVFVSLRDRVAIMKSIYHLLASAAAVHTD
jgi:HAD superfamily hydrolase (TIGR01509 family)